MPHNGNRSTVKVREPQDLRVKGVHGGQNQKHRGVLRPDTGEQAFLADGSAYKRLRDQWVGLCCRGVSVVWRGRGVKLKR